MSQDFPISYKDNLGYCIHFLDATRIAFAIHESENDTGLQRIFDFAIISKPGILELQCYLEQIDTPEQFYHEYNAEIMKNHIQWELNSLDFIIGLEYYSHDRPITIMQIMFHLMDNWEGFKAQTLIMEKI